MWTMSWQNPLFLCLSSLYQLEMQIWQVALSALLNPSCSGCAALLLLWHGICTEATIPTLPEHLNWVTLLLLHATIDALCLSSVSPLLRGWSWQAKQRDATSSFTLLLPIKSLVTTCASNTISVSSSVFNVGIQSVFTAFSVTFILLSFRAQLDLCRSVCDVILCLQHISKGLWT